MPERYFQSCWLMLKLKRPDLWDEMTKMELVVANLRNREDEPEKEQDVTVL